MFTGFDTIKGRTSRFRSRGGDINGKAGKELATRTSRNKDSNREQRQARREPSFFLHLIFRALPDCHNSESMYADG